jgi:hypothetical protein
VELGQLIAVRKARCAYARAKAFDKGLVDTAFRVQYFKRLTQNVRMLQRDLRSQVVGRRDVNWNDESLSEGRVEANSEG